MAKKPTFTPWSSLGGMIGKTDSQWPEDEQQRIAAYEKYDQMYWNDPTQYAIRILEGEQPLYIPNARKIVDTTAYYLMKGLKITLEAPAKTTENIDKTDEDSPEGTDAKFLSDWLKREAFYSKFNLAKSSGVARGDFVFHITGDPDKAENERVSIETLHPGTVRRVYDDVDPEKVVEVNIVEHWWDPEEENAQEQIKVLSYYKNLQTNRISRDEQVYDLAPVWFEDDSQPVKTLLAEEELDASITQLPVYWFNNIDWEGQEFGSSELRGLEFLNWAISQGATDTEMALALEGLGVYATDGGRPVNDDGLEVDWEVAPGKVMEVPQGSYFRRVEGVGSITPMMDQIEYLEKKVNEATGITSVAAGDVDVQTAESGIALAIKFLPTLAKIEHRDTAFVDKLVQMFHDLKSWFVAYEGRNIIPDILVTIAASKLPIDRDGRINELNNMLDRKIISRKHYRREMVALGYEFPENLEKEIEEERKADAELAALAAPPNLQANAEAAAKGEKLPPTSNPDNGKQETKKENNSNNKGKVNESDGTEARQTTKSQTRAGKA